MYNISGGIPKAISSIFAKSPILRENSMKSKLSRFDEFFITIVKETGGIEGLLHSLFQFLYRKTDYYYECDPGDKMGFPPGVAQKMVLNVFDGYQKEHYKYRAPKKDPVEYQQKLKVFQEQKKGQTKPQTVVEAQPKAQNVVESQPKLQNVVEESNPVPQKVEVMKEEKPEQGAAKKMEVEKKVPPETIEEKQVENVQEIVEKNSEKQVKGKTDPKMEMISAYNGDITEKYVWSQSVTDVTVQVKVPEGTKSKMLEVDIGTASLSIKIKGSKEYILKGDLYDRIKKDDSTWNLDDNKSVILTLEKASENIWKTVLKGDKEIDATKVDNSKKLDEFDYETQGALRKIMYEQQRKNMGLPTTEEEKQQELLKKAWNAEGSPFKGQPFDPSKFNIPGGNTFNMD